ncbi:MAG TPA: hypothetical protein VGF69_24450 [Thermoanaerobaculia bacterium]|jgi:YHS domain-containing protein
MNFLFLLLLATATPAAATPEECLAGRDTKATVTVEHAGKTYRLASEECRQQFLEDPERYGQLYDALLELQAAGEELKPARASLVPS